MSCFGRSRYGVFVGLVGWLVVGSVGGCEGKTAVPPFPEDQWASARIVTAEADLIGGPLAQGQIGDVLLTNGRVRFIVQDPANARGYLPYGGTVIDADIVRPAGEPGQDRLGEVAPIVGYIRFLAADTMEVIHDGRGGRPAVVRVTGRDGPMPLLESTLPLAPSDVTAQVDYILEPEATSLIIESTITYVGSKSSNTVMAGDGLMLGDLMQPCSSPDEGCDGDPWGSVGVLGGYTAGLVSYGYFDHEDNLRAELNLGEVVLMIGANAPLAPQEKFSYRRYLAVGDGDMTSIQAEMLRRRGIIESRLIAGRVTLSSGDPGVGAAVDVWTPEGEWETRALADSSGEFRATVAPGRYELVAWLPGRDASEPGEADVTTGDGSGIDLTLADPARVVLDVRDDQGQPVPARVMFLPGTEPALGAGDTLTIYSVDGTGEGVLPPGEYVAAVTRGYEYDYDWVPVTAVAGETVTVAASLAHVVDTTGYLNVDPHTHTRFSMDSQLDEHDRVRQAAAEHVELVVATDHDHISDLTPAIDAAQATETVISARGVEITPMPFHINAYPLQNENPQRAGYYPIVWWETGADGEVSGIRTPTAIFADARDALGAQIIQINHPREQALGVLDHVGYDPLVGFGGIDGVEAEFLDTSFNAVEIVNNGWQDNDLEALQDWYSFLNQGLRTVAVGVSDSHGLYTVLGNCRTLVAVPDDVVTPDLDLQPVWDSLLAQRATVVVGPFVELWAVGDASDLAPMGGEVTRVTPGAVPLRVRIQAANFVQTSRLIIVANGQVVLTVDLPDPGDPPAPLRFDDTVWVDWSGGDAWFVAMVEGDVPMVPLEEFTARSVTNPVYVDRDGDAVWTAPGL
jgi:Carboxypeptidase regulatory-like domain